MRDRQIIEADDKWRLLLSLGMKLRMIASFGFEDVSARFTTVSDRSLS